MQPKHRLQPRLHVREIVLARLPQDGVRQRIELRPELGFVAEVLQPGWQHVGQSIQFRIELRARFHGAARGQRASTRCTLPSSTSGKRMPACSMPSSCSVAAPASRCSTAMT